MGFLMELAGSLEDNLVAAVESVRRHRDHAVYRDTVKYWSDLLQYARQTKSEKTENLDAIDDLLVELDLAVLERRSG